MNENTDILIEKSLAGALSPEETVELDALLAADAALREHLNALRRDEALLGSHIDTGLARVDWSRVRRIRLRLNLDGLLRPLGLSLLGAACLWQLFFVADNWWDRLGMTLWGVIAGSWAAKAWIERRRTQRRLAWLERGDDEKEFLARYRIVLEREWKKVRSNTSSVGCAAVFLLFFAAVGKYPKACLAALAFIVLVRTFEYFSIVRPLRREREELGE